MSDSKTEIGVGLYMDLPAKTYHALDMCSASRLRVLSQETPLHLLHELRNPKEPSLDMRIGTALHTLVLEGEEAFAEQYAIGGPINESTGKPYGSDTKKFSEWQAHQMLKKGVVDCFNHHDGERIRMMSNAIWAHEDAADLLRACEERELSIVGELHGSLCKGRIDAYGVANGGTMLDIKTTSRGCSPDAFERMVSERGYDIQCGVYEALLAAHSRPVRHCVFIAVETEPPYAVACHRMKNSTLALMELYVPSLIERYTRCHNTGHWPGWGIHDVGLAGWRVQQINRALGVEGGGFNG